MSEKNKPELLKPNPSRDRPPRRYFFRSIARRLFLLSIIMIAGLFWLSLTASRPSHLGAKNGVFAKCPESPNCVSTQADDSEHQMSPIPVSGTAEAMIQGIKMAVESESPKAKLVSQTNNYLHFEFKSLIFGFIDDVEFIVDDKASLVHFRSASRVGHFDLGANRKRMEHITESLKR